MKLNSTRIYEIIQDRISIESIRLKHRIQLHIAVLIKRGKILEIATNAVGSRSRGAGFDTRSIHAERAVIRKLGDLNKLDGAVLAVIRITKGTKQVVNSEPCHSCKCHLEKCIRDYGLRTVYYSS
jgi:hypothetical protein